MVDEYYQQIMIDDEKETIKYYAREIGQCKWMLERQTESKNKQLWQYFLAYAEAELEFANERLEKYRTELIDWQRQQRELSAV